MFSILHSPSPFAIRYSLCKETQRMLWPGLQSPAYFPINPCCCAITVSSV